MQVNVQRACSSTIVVYCVQAFKIRAVRIMMDDENQNRSSWTILLQAQQWRCSEYHYQQSARPCKSPSIAQVPLYDTALCLLRQDM